MGIQGLLPLLKSIQKPCNLKKFAGQTLGVDAYGWLHRGTVACAVELATDKPTTKFVDFAMSRVRMLIHFGIRPYLVFDGDYLPSKSGTEKDRAARRRESKKAGLELLRMGKTAQAQLELQKSVDVTPEMARQLIEELKKAKVDYVVAPFEADSQMVYLERQGVIQGILSEDSDLLVFGAKCLITKLDQYGDCIEINRNDFTACREISLVGWSDAEFRWMAILSGCDYLPGIDKMGLKTAYRMLRKHKTVERTIRAVQFDGKLKVPAGYLEAFRQAELTFLHQWVYCPTAKSLVNLTEPEDDVDVHSLDYIGKQVEAHIATKVAEGWLHPHSKQPLVVPSAGRRTSRTPMQAIQETPSLKKHQSIESFFKPRRTPLAELDPNSFTPSPSQQRLLEQQQQASWSAEPTGLRPAPARALTDITRAHTQPVRRAISDAWPLTASKSPKRQRLCSDNSLGIALSRSQTATAATSRFFSRSTIDSPSVRKGSKAAKNGSNDINIWSDDSIEEAMSQLPEASDGKPSSRKISIFRDDEDATIASIKWRGPSQEDSQGTANTSQGTDHTPATSVASVSQDIEDKAKNSIFSASLSADMACLKAEFTFQGPQDHARSETSQPPLKARQGPKNITDIPCSSPTSNEHVEDPSTGDIDDQAWLAMEARPLAPLPLKEDLEPVSSRETPKGSEDLLVPDSEGEEEISPKPAFKLDMSKFAFTG